MAIIGKIWSAVLFRKQVTNVTEDPFADFKTILWYNGLLTSPAEIASYYPSLTWDEAIEKPDGTLRGGFLPWRDADFGSGDAYSSDEDAILDIPNFTYDDALPGGRWGGNGLAYQFLMRFIGGVWVTEYDLPYAGTPGRVEGIYPLANTFNITTPTPFGAFGNGLIQQQALFWSNNGLLPPAFAWPPPDPFPNSDQIFLYAYDQTYIFTPQTDTAGGSGFDGGGDLTIATDSLTLRSWGFKLDGHKFYVLRLGDSGTLVYDLSTGTWSEWQSPGRTAWRAHVGQNWVGCANFDVANGDTDVFAGDDATGSIWRINVVKGRDERTTADLFIDDKITKMVVGGVQVTGRDSVPCNAVQLDLALGNPTQTGAAIVLEISDDLGETWVNCGPVEIVADDYSAVVEWRGLGQMTQPGRLFRLTDDGATVRIGGATLR